MSGQSRPLDGKVAIVTGGSRGIGAAIVRRLVLDGSHVVLSYLQNDDAASSLVNELHPRVAALRADATDPSATNKVFDEAAERHGGVDIFIGSAGVGILAPFEATSEQAYDRLFSVTRGTFFALQTASRRLRPGGRIVTLSTGLTRSWAPMAAAYAGSKAAIEQFTRSLSKEVGRRGITANAVLPGVVDTDMTAAMPQPMRDAAAAQTSLGRLAQPADIADVVAFLCSDDARWITGQMIVANGGSTP